MTRVGGAARKLVPGAIGEGLGSAAQIAGSAAAGKNVLASAGEVAGHLAPGILGKGVSALAGAVGGAASPGKPSPMDIIVKHVPSTIASVASAKPSSNLAGTIAKYLPDGIPHASAVAAGLGLPALGAIPLPSSSPVIALLPAASSAAAAVAPLLGAVAPVPTGAPASEGQHS